MHVSMYARSLRRGRCYVDSYRQWLLLQVMTSTVARAAIVALSLVGAAYVGLGVESTDSNEQPTVRKNTGET